MGVTNRSSFTHVLYFIINNRRMTSFVKDFKYRRYIAIAHYSDVKELISYRYGIISLDEWLEKDLNPRSKSRRF